MNSANIRLGQVYGDGNECLGGQDVCRILPRPHIIAPSSGKIKFPFICVLRLMDDPLRFGGGEWKFLVNVAKGASAVSRLLAPLLRACRVTAFAIFFYKRKRTRNQPNDGMKPTLIPVPKPCTTPSSRRNLTWT